MRDRPPVYRCRLTDAVAAPPLQGAIAQNPERIAAPGPTRAVDGLDDLHGTRALRRATRHRAVSMFVPHAHTVPSLFRASACWTPPRSRSPSEAPRLHRRGTLRRRAVAELAVTVQPPRPDAPVALEREREFGRQPRQRRRTTAPRPARVSSVGSSCRHRAARSRCSPTPTPCHRSAGPACDAHRSRWRPPL